MANVNDFIDQRRFDLRSVRKALDSLDFPELVQRLQAPEFETYYVRGMGYWKPGDGHPALADEDPAVMGAIARCALNRSRMVVTGLTFSPYHSSRCGWCEFPIRELLIALDWNTYHGRLIEVEYHVWRQGTGPKERWVSYSRPSASTGHFENPRAEAFHNLTPQQQKEAIDSIQEASRVGLDPKSHDPWCRYEPDHGGECSPPPEGDQ